MNAAALISELRADSLLTLVFLPTLYMAWCRGKPDLSRRPVPAQA